MKPRVYLETSIISYLASRPSRDLIVAAHQQASHSWREESSLNFELLISPFVLDEIAQGDVHAARQRLAWVEKLSCLSLTPAVEQLGVLLYTLRTLWSELTCGKTPLLKKYAPFAPSV